jgi:hypothetical protein
MYNVIFMTCDGCPPLPGLHYTFGEADDYAGKALRLAREDSAIRNVVLAALWPNSLSPTAHYNIEKFTYADGTSEIFMDKLRAYIKDFVALGKNVYLILSIPFGDEFDPKYLLASPLRKKQSNGLDRAVLEGRNNFAEIQADLERVGREAGATVINPLDFLCSGRRCEALDGAGNPIYFDDAHLRASYVRRQVNWLDETVFPSASGP